MTNQHSAGIILYCPLAKTPPDGSTFGVWLIHPGGFLNKRAPFCLPKGHVEPGEDVWRAAVRELKEETGVNLQGHPATEFVFLGSHQQSSHKQISIFAFLYREEISNPPPSNLCEIEFPKGVFTQVPEVDQVKFFSIEEAKKMILPSQLPLLIRLENYLKSG